MDVYCATCQEPWDHHHLLSDLAWEVWDGVENSSSHLLIKKFLKSPRVDIPKMLREDLEAQGWKFGRSIVCVLECCCCAGNVADGEDPKKTELRKELRLEAESLMGDDLDGLISTLTSVDAYAELG